MSFQMLIGIIKWKLRMNKLKKTDIFTEEGWKACVDALQFFPEDQRQGFMEQYVSVVLQM